MQSALQTSRNIVEKREAERGRRRNEALSLSQDDLAVPEEYSPTPW